VALHYFTIIERDGAIDLPAGSCEFLSALASIVPETSLLALIVALLGTTFERLSRKQTQFGHDPPPLC
jgi:hypothetical protein